MPEERLTVWKLYANTEVTREKNREIDDLANWLENNFIYRQHSHAQYFKHALNKTLKINNDQIILNFFNSSNNIDYVSVQNPDDTQPVYYFVTAKRWIAEKTIELTLLMDTINTFKNNYVLSEKTTIDREHENRFFINDDGYMRRIVDKVDEGLQPPLYKTRTYNVWNDLPPLIEFPAGSGNYVYDYEAKDTSKFYLFYANTYSKDPEDKQNPLNGFGCFNVEKQFLVRYLGNVNLDNVIGQANCWIIDPVKLGELVLSPEGYHPIITNKNGARVGVEFITITPVYYEQFLGFDTTYIPLFKRGGTATEVRIPVFFDGSYYYTAAIYYADGSWRAQEIRIDFLTGAITKGKVWEVSNANLNLFTRTAKYDQKVCYHQFTKAAYDALTNYYNIGAASDYALGYHLVKIGNYNTIDRTDVKLQKIIELPYAPDQFPTVTINNQSYPSLIDSNFEYGEFNNGKYLQLADLGASFRKTLHCEDPIRYMKEGFDKTPRATDTASINNESKLFNSAFWLSKFVYDSFNYNFNYEQADDWSDATIDFVPTSTMNSKWAFIFNWNRTNEKEDFGNVLLVSRNNELPIYNNEYLNYIRTSYNYEKKLRESQLTLQAAGGAFRIGAGAAAMYAGTDWEGATEGKTNSKGETTYSSLPVAGGMGLIFSGVQNVMNSVSSAILAEQAQAQKMEVLKNQKTSVLGGDDIDLLNAYCGNKAQLLRYQITDDMRNMIYELFRYYGYKRNKRGNPRDFTTNGNKRYWYNFIKCEPVFEETLNISEECLKDIENRYKEGITIFHSHNGEYDFDQEKENWEEGLIGHNEPVENPLDEEFTDIGTRTSDGGHWLMTPPVYGKDTSMESNQRFQYFVFKGNTADPSYNFTATDAFGNAYEFNPGNGKCTVTMTRLSDGRTFAKELGTGIVWKLSGVFTTSGVPWTTSIAAPFEYSLEAQYI